MLMYTNNKLVTVNYQLILNGRYSIPIDNGVDITRHVSIIIMNFALILYIHSYSVMQPMIT